MREATTTGAARHLRHDARDDRLLQLVQQIVHRDAAQPGERVERELPAQTDASCSTWLQSAER